MVFNHEPGYREVFHYQLARVRIVFELIPPHHGNNMKNRRSLEHKLITLKQTLKVFYILHFM